MVKERYIYTFGAFGGNKSECLTGEYLQKTVKGSIVYVAIDIPGRLPSGVSFVEKDLDKIIQFVTKITAPNALGSEDIYRHAFANTIFIKERALSPEITALYTLYEYDINKLYADMMA